MKKKLYITGSLFISSKLKVEVVFVLMLELPQYILYFKQPLSTIRCFTCTSKDGFGVFVFLALKTKRKSLKA